LSNDRANKLISCYQDLIESNIDDSEKIKISYIIAGIKFAVFNSIGVRLTPDLGRSKFSKELIQSYQYGIDLIKNAKPGRKPGKGIQLNHIVVDNTTFNGLEHISKKRGKALNARRKEAYYEYIVNHREELPGGNLPYIFESSCDS